MVLKLFVTLCCLASVALAYSVPSFAERRSSRDVDKIDGLRARLLRLQKQIYDLEAEEQNRKAAEARGRERGSDVSSELRDAVSRLPSGRESQMTSRRQQQVQQLARNLDQGTKSDLHALAETLNQLVRETTPRLNTAGEYLGDSYNSYRGQRLADSNSEEYSDEPVSEEEEGEEEEVDEKERLQNIYNMLVKMYNNPSQGGQVSVEPRVSPSESPSRQSASEFELEEGRFGDFVDGEEEDRPTGSSRSRQQMRHTVMAAIESKLLRDIQDAQQAGITVEDIINDVQNKADRVKSERLRLIEKQLNDLSRRAL